MKDKKNGYRGEETFRQESCFSQLKNDRNTKQKLHALHQLRASLDVEASCFSDEVLFNMHDITENTSTPTRIRR